MSALLGILQLDRGDPWGFGEVPGLIQAWLQDAGGFAAVGLVAYLWYALKTPTDKSQSEKLRVPVSQWMLVTAGLALVAYALVAATLFVSPTTSFKLFGKVIAVAPLPPPPPPPGSPPAVERPEWHTELRPTLLALAGLFALLSLGEPFARDLVKIARRNLSFGSAGLRRFGRTLAEYSSDLLTPNRVALLVAALAGYALIGVALYFIGVPRLTEIWTQILLVGVGVFVCALLLLMLFEAEGPVWAIAKLSFKEAIRSQVLWIFMIIFLPFLFPLGWFSTVKSTDAIRTTTVMVTLVLSLLTLIPAALVTAFGIPNDIKNLNIFTVVSKPIERFEIVLGRFVGYVALMTLVLLALTGVSLVLVANSSASEKARAASYKARVPYRGTLDFKSIVATDRKDKEEFKGINVGREFEYRKYIAGAPNSPHRIIWHFATVPAEFKTAEGDRVPVEFTFDIYKLTKGVQNKGADVQLVFVTHNAPLRQPGLGDLKTKDEDEWKWVNPEQQRKREDRIKELSKEGINPEDFARSKPGTKEWEAANKVAEEFGYYMVKKTNVLDYQVMGVDIPAGLIRNALSTSDADMPKDVDGKPRPRLTVYVKCESEGQMLGAAEPDLYLLRDELPFWFNYLKGTVGLWCRLCIVIGLAVACSTYLSGVLSLLATAFIFIVGFFTDHMSELAQNRAIGGGPFRAISQLVKAEQPTAPLSDSAATKTILFGDRAWAWLIRRWQNVFPDVDSFSWGHFVSEGFNVNTEYLFVNLLVTFGYLLPWAVLAYYLMKSREVAA